MSVIFDGISGTSTLQGNRTQNGKQVQILWKILKMVCFLHIHFLISQLWIVRKHPSKRFYFDIFGSIGIFNNNTIHLH